MQTYYFYQHSTEHYIYLTKTPRPDQQPEFIWVDCTRADVVNRAEQWSKQLQQETSLLLNELHIRDILNLEHPCVFDSMDDYDLLIFRKLISPEDQLITGDQALEKHESFFGLSTTPTSFIISPQVLVTVREQGNKAIENFISRIESILCRAIEDQNKPRKLASTPIDLTLRLLNTMVDGYLELRAPLTARVEFWQQQLLQGHRRFTQWNQLLQENMAFQQVENICEEQIETLQELRDELVENYSHLRGKKHFEKQDLILLRVDDLSSHVERIQKHTTRLRNAIQAAIDLHFSAIANQTNENMRILAIITAIFAPLTLLTGIYGMNFDFIPGLKDPRGFWLMMAVMLITTATLIIFFYRRHLVGRGESSVMDMLAQQHKDQHVNLFWFINDQPIKKTMQELEKISKFK